MVPDFAIGADPCETMGTFVRDLCPNGGDEKLTAGFIRTIPHVGILFQTVADHGFRIGQRLGVLVSKDRVDRLGLDNGSTTFMSTFERQLAGVERTVEMTSETFQTVMMATGKRCFSLRIILV